ncbi:MAG: M20/M25/M40 family metallo-hydrolase [Planctomycetota bacterium]
MGVLSLHAASVAVVAAHAATQDHVVTSPPTPASISMERLRADVAHLASVELGGRGTGQPGFQRAADFVRDRLQALGLQPLGDDGTFFQAVPWTRTEAIADACSLVASTAAGEVVLKPSPDFAGRVWFDQTAEGELAVWRCTDPMRVEVDAGAAAGRILLVEVAPPDLDTRFAGLEGARTWATFESRLRATGAAAVLFVDDARARRLAGLEGNESPGKSSPAARASSRTPNELYLGVAAAERLAGLAPPAEPSADSLRLLPVTVRLTIAVRSGPAPACNVVARLPGSDTELSAEHVVLGCHLDHLGVRTGVLHPGADDDGSGTAALLALAESFARTTDRPRRSLAFAAFCGEELGLIGSKHFVAHPPIPLASIVAELQLDMVGRSEENARETADQNRNSLHLIGTEKLSEDLHRLCLAANRDVGKFDLEWDEEEVFWRSDHVNFARQGVPIAFFFTGFHHDYHAPSDTADKIEYEKLARVIEYVHAVAARLAQQDERPLVDRRRWDKSRERLHGPSQPAAPLRR